MARTFFFPYTLKPMKFNILIADDEDSGRNSLKILLEKYFWANIDSLSFSNSFEDAKEKLIANQFDILFLDINLNGSSAFDLLVYIPSSTKVIFVTAYSDFVTRALRIKAFDYILKPIKVEELSNCLDRLLCEYSDIAKLGHLQIKERGLTKLLKISEIIYLKGDGPYCTFYNSTESFTTSRTLKSVLPDLGNAFVRIHKSYIVNRDFIKGHTNRKLFLLNELCLPVSRTGLKNL